MKALIYKGPGEKGWEHVPDPKIEQPTDVVVKMLATTICGTDLHILNGDVPEVEVGRILGHEGIGVVTEVGEGVTQLAVGDRVILACVSSCGKCSNCRKGLYSHCLDTEGMAGIGWIFGYMIDGTQAEYVRVPFAENSVYKVPEGMTDAEGILLSDILPTGFEMGVQYGHVAPGDVVAVIGSGPVGLSAVMTARLYGPSKVIAIDSSRAIGSSAFSADRRSSLGTVNDTSASRPSVSGSFWMIVSTLTPASASAVKIAAAAPGRSGTPVSVIRASSVECVTAVIRGFSIVSFSPITTVPGPSSKLERQWIRTPCVRAYSTDLSCSTFAPDAAISSISSNDTNGSLRASGTIRGSAL